MATDVTRSLIEQYGHGWNLYICLACLGVMVTVCLFVPLFVSNERQNDWTNRA